MCGTLAAETRSPSAQRWQFGQSGGTGRDAGSSYYRGWYE
jgi:hypothetical protein